MTVNHDVTGSSPVGGANETRINKLKGLFVRFFSFKAVANAAESGIIESDQVRTAGKDVHTIGKIDRNIYRCITEDITTDEVIITDERISHINKRHPNNFNEISHFFEIALKEPDYILSDLPNTGLILKVVEENGIRMQIVLRIHTSSDDPNYKNSIISAWKISESRWNNYLRNKKILYISE